MASQKHQSRPVAILRGENLRPVSSLVWQSEDCLIVAHQDGCVVVWDMKSKRITNCSHIHKNSILSMAFSRRHNFLITSSRDGSSKVVDLNTVSEGKSSPIFELNTGAKHFCNSSVDWSSNIIATPSQNENEVIEGSKVFLSNIVITGASLGHENRLRVHDVGIRQETWNDMLSALIQTRGLDGFIQWH